MSQPHSSSPGTGSRPPPLPVPPLIHEPPRIPPPLPARPRLSSRRPPPLPSSGRIPPLVARIFKSEPPPIRKPSLLTPGELERFKNLLVFAKSAVEGYYVGKHKSPYRGSSVEFTDYKEYVPGDEVHRIDWRAYGRSRRLFVRQYEAETNMVIYLLVDVSASMRYAGTGRQSKYLLAAKIAAALGYLMIRQGDKAALGLFAEKLLRFLPPGGTRHHLHNLVTELEAVEPASTTGIARALQEANALFRKRGRLVILSDFWTDSAEFLDALGQFLHRKFEILLLHVLDPDELELPTANAARFEDMETREQVQVELDEIRAAYARSMRQRLDDLAREANHRQISHAVVNTTRPYLDAIEAYLGFRETDVLSTR
jgi:uncharacterized protein (DUF58 family)